MTTRKVMIVGLGKRVREVALPAFARAADAYAVVDVRARTARPAAGGLPEVRALEALKGEELAEIDLVYVAVGKPAVPDVLARLGRYDRGRLELLIETPVLVAKQFRAAASLDGWRKVTVAEDCARLPWYDVVRAASASWLGTVREVEFAHSAWKYHGLAMLKALLGDERIRRARRIGPVDGGRREFVFAGGGRGTVLEPRDYATGSFTVVGEGGRLSDAPADGAVRLEALLEGDRVRGFAAGEARTTLDDDEVALQEARPAAAGVTARMEDWKRIGLLRLLRELAADGPGYPVARGLDDMLVDDLLDRIGRASSLGVGLLKRLARLPR
ncbi:MAG: hypothetical protein ACF8XB_17945 [Planctomycetota bacterium JB042]